MNAPSSPRVLIVTSKRWWIGVSRLPMALHQAGFTVAAWCPEETFLARSQGTARHFRWDPAANWKRELLRVHDEWRPDLIIPADETIAAFLRKLTRSRSLPGGDKAISRVLLNSLGDPIRGAALDGKIELQRLARELGIRNPDDHKVANLGSAKRVAGLIGYPLVLKDEFSAGGAGVKICISEAELAAAWSGMEGNQGPRSWKDRLRHFVRNPFCRDARRRSVQKYIRGRPAFHSAVAWQGKRLGGITAVVEVANPPVTGPSCVVRLQNLPEVSEACTRLIAHTGASGFLGFDFMIEEGSGHAYLLECNPRPTPVSHLGGLAGDDLCVLLRAALEGRTPATQAPAAPKDLLVAFFPQELLRDPQSPYLEKAFIDFPVADGPLLNALLERYPELAEAMRTAGRFIPPH